MDKSIQLTDQEKELILAYASNDMNTAKTARALYFHKNNVLYHLKSIYKKSKLNPRCFYDLCKLVTYARIESIK